MKYEVREDKNTFKKDFPNLYENMEEQALALHLVLTEYYFAYAHVGENWCYHEEYKMLNSREYTCVEVSMNGE